MSKGLKALKIIKQAPTIYVGCASDIYTRYSFECKDIEKELKALEIVKERKVDIYLLEITKNVNQYNRPFGDHLVSLCRLLNEEEYDLLKEVLL